MIPNIVPFLAINNMLSSQRSSYRSSHRHTNISNRISNSNCRCGHSDPEQDLLDDEFGFAGLTEFNDEIDFPIPMYDEFESIGFNDLPDISLCGPTAKSNEKEPPYNLLFEIYRLGLTHGIGCFGGHSENIQKITSEMNKLSKKFGYNGYEDFDRFFDENEKLE